MQTVKTSGRGGAARRETSIRDPPDEAGRPTAATELRQTRPARRAPDPLGRAAADPDLRARGDGEDRPALVVGGRPPRRRVADGRPRRQLEPSLLAAESSSRWTACSGAPTLAPGRGRRSCAASHRAAAPAQERRPRPRRPARDREPGRAQGTRVADLALAEAASARRRDASRSAAADSTPARRRPARRTARPRSRVHRRLSAATCSARWRSFSTTRTSRRSARAPRVGRPGFGSPRSRLEDEEDKRGFVHRFAGDERAVSDYLLNEIFDRLPESRRRFVLRTAVPQATHGRPGRRVERRPERGACPQRAGDGELPHLEPGRSARRRTATTRCSATSCSPAWRSCNRRSCGRCTVALRTGPGGTAIRRPRSVMRSRARTGISPTS